MTVDEALVLGGGGVSGIAWMTGLLTGLAEAGQDGAAEDSGSMIVGQNWRYGRVGD